MKSFCDAFLSLTIALPNGAATTTSAARDAGPAVNGGNGLDTFDLMVSAPALNSTQMPDGKTMIYEILNSDNADLSSPVVARVLTQTGADGAGAAAAQARFEFGSNAKQYWGFRAIGSGAGNAAAASARLEAYF